MAAVGLDIGGGSTKFGLVSDAGDLLASRRVVMQPGQTADDIVAAYVAAIADLGGRGLPIGVAYPGHIDHAGNVGLNSNVPALDGQPLVDRLGQHFGVKTALLNDADAAAYAESLRHPEGVSGCLLLITLGTGIGVAMSVKGQTVVTAGGTLGDSGHMNLDPAGQFQCRLGCTGCLESLVSAGAIERDATALAVIRPGRALAAARAMATDGVVSAATVCRLALEGDPDALALVSRIEDWLAMAAASWRATFHPDLICFGGGLSALGPAFIHRLQTKANARSLPFLTYSPLRLASLGNDAGMIGAGLKALHLS